MLAGLFLSKFDREGLAYLGFSSFREAFNAIGCALKGKPNSIKNHMQEFDPLLQNNRKGWHLRPLRDHCREAFERFGKLSIAEFSNMLAPLLLPGNRALPEGLEEIAAFEDDWFDNDSFSKRLVTGAAAEGFFESEFSRISEFAGHSLENVTQYGCGFDFRLQSEKPETFLAVEVKGIAGSGGEITMTEKEHRVAEYLQNRYFLCVVRNFVATPEIVLFRNPLSRDLGFVSRERKLTSLTWHARITA